MQILVMSCDKNRDLFYPFFHCMEKYWPDHPQINYSTETIRNPFYRTYSANYPLEQWTRRVRDTANLIEDDRILLMCDDVFLRTAPNKELIDKMLADIKDNVAAFNFETSCYKDDIPLNEYSLKRAPNGAYKTSVMCQLWDKDKLMRIMDCDLDPWRFEYANRHNNYDFLILKDKLALDWGHHRYGDKWGVYRNSWVKEAVDFLTKEGLNIDFSIRGII